MSSEWYEVSLGEFADINPRRTISKGACAKFIDMAALPIYGRDIDNKDIALREFTSGGAKFRNGDTLLARITPCLENGKTAFVSCLSGGEFAFGSTEFIVLGPKSVDDSLFLYYLARSEEFRTYAISRMEGTSGRQRVPNSAVAEYRFLCPPPTVRSEIGRVLGGIDDRISSLRETNATLEAIAQALFKSWFVDFDPVHANAGTQAPSLPPEIQALFPATFTDSPQGPIPEGWEWSKIGDLVTTTDYVANGSFAALKENVQLLDEPSYALYVRTTDHNSGFTGGYRYVSKSAYDFLSKSSLEGYEVIISNVGDVGTVFRPPRWLGLPMTLGSNAIALKSKALSSYLYFHFSGPRGQHDIQSIVTGSAQLKFNKTNFRSLQLLLPPKPIIERFELIASDLISKIEENRAMLQSLVSLRDTLLPRLISGQLRLPEAEQAIAAMTD